MREALVELLFGRRVSSQAWDKLYRADLFPDVRFPDGCVFEDIATMQRLVMRACPTRRLTTARGRGASPSSTPPPTSWTTG